MSVQFGCFFDTELGKLVHPDVVPVVRAILSTPNMSATDGLLAVEAYLQRYACTMRHIRYSTTLDMSDYSWRFVNRLGAGVGFLPTESLDIPKPIIAGYEYIDLGDPCLSTIMFDNDTSMYYIGNWGSISETLPSNDNLYDIEYTEDEE